MRRFRVFSLAAGIVFLLAGCAGQDVRFSNQALKEISAGNYLQAEADLNKALAINPDNPYVLLNLGVVYQSTDRPEKAMKMYERVIALNPKDKAVTSNQEGMAGRPLVEIARHNLALIETQEAEKRRQAEAAAEAARIAKEEMAKAKAPPPPPAPPPKPASPPEPKAAPPPKVPAEPVPAPVKPGHYRIEREEGLAHVAGQKRVYGDPLMWPSLLRLNPGVLKIAKDPSALPRQELPAGTELRFVTREMAEAERLKIGKRFWAVNVASLPGDELMGPLVVPLVQAAYRPYLSEVTVKRTVFRRLRVGFFSDSKEAEAAAKEIQMKLRLSERPWVQEVEQEEFERYAGF